MAVLAVVVALAVAAAFAGSLTAAGAKNGQSRQKQSMAEK